MMEIERLTTRVVKSKAYGKFASLFQYEIPVAIWSRIIFLSLALSLTKLGILAAFKKHLFEIHWRTASERPSWMDGLAFYGFAALLGTHLWLLGRGCARQGVSTIRKANALIIILGLVFIFLTFHEGDKNYLTSVMHGFLGWQNLGAYFSLNFFFRPPFLAVWLAVYAVIYYALRRAGKEVYTLQITAIFATAYYVLCLSDLRDFRNALIGADAVGIAGLFAALKSGGKRLGWFAMLLPFFLMALACGFLAPWNGTQPKPEFAVLTEVSVVLLGGITLLVWRSGFLSAWSWGLPFAFSAFVLLLNRDYPAAANYQNLLCNGLFLPHYFLDEFFITGLLLFAAVVYSRWRPASTLIGFDILILGIITFGLIDLRVSELMETRFDYYAASLAWGETPKMMWRMAKPYLPTFLFGCLLLISIYFGFLWVMRRTASRISSPTSGAIETEPSGGEKSWFKIPGVKFSLIVFVLLGFAGNIFVRSDKVKGAPILVLAKTSPLWQRVLVEPWDENTFRSKAKKLGMKNLLRPSPFCAPRGQRDLNVVFIFQESTYNKHLSLFGGTAQTQPLLSGYKDRMEIFPNFFSSFAGSINARFAAFTGLYPVQDFQDFTFSKVPVQSLFESLHENGYSNSLFYSSSFDYTGFRDFLKGRWLDEMYDASNMPGERKGPSVSWGLPEDETLMAIKNRLREYAAQKQKFSLTYIPAAPHNPFDGTPKQFRKYKLEQVGDFTPLYLNELLYMDWVIASIIDELKQSGLLEHTLVIITSDHGEMLGENQTPIGHGWKITPELANVPLIIMDPAQRGFKVNSKIGSHVDLPPTILDLLGIDVRSRFIQGNSLYSLDEQNPRTIYLSSFQQYGIISGTNLICGDRNGKAQEFTIGWDGSKPVFNVIKDSPRFEGSIQEFDTFQQNFLRNYSHYLKFIKP